MPKLSPEDRKALEQQLADDDAADDDDDDIEVGFSDGSYVKGKYRRVSEAAAARGMRLRPDPAPDDDGKGKPKTDSNVKRFSGRRVS